MQSSENRCYLIGGAHKRSILSTQYPVTRRSERKSRTYFLQTNFNPTHRHRVGLRKAQQMGPLLCRFLSFSPFSLSLAILTLLTSRTVIVLSPLRNALAITRFPEPSFGGPASSSPLLWLQLAQRTAMRLPYSVVKLPLKKHFPLGSSRFGN